MTGSRAALGESALKAVRMAFDEATKDSKYTYEMIVGDDQQKCTLTSNIITEMVSVNKINAAITFFSGAGLVARPLAEQHKFIHACVSWEDSIVDGKYNFAQDGSREGVAAKILEQMKFWPDAKNIAVLAETRPGIATLAALLQEKFGSEGYNVSMNYIHRGEKELRVLIRKLKNQGASLFILLLLPPELEIIVKQMHEADIANSNITGINFEISQNMELLEGIRFVSPSTYTEEFAKKMGEEVTHPASIAYDLMHLFVRAYEANYQEGKIPSADEISKYILSLGSYDSASVKCTVTPQGFIVNPTAVMMVKDGKAVFVEE